MKEDIRIEAVNPYTTKCYINDKEIVLTDKRIKHAREEYLTNLIHKIISYTCGVIFFFVFAGTIGHVDYFMNYPGQDTWTVGNYIFFGLLSCIGLFISYLAIKYSSVDSSDNH